MRRILISLSMMLLLVLSLCTVNVFSATQAGVNVNASTSYYAERFEYDRNGNITGYNGNNDKYIYVPDETSSGKPIKAINNMVFYNNSALEVLEVSEGINSIGWLNFFNCPNLSAIILHAENPITHWTSIFGLQLDNDVKIYVPDSAYNKYKEASGWEMYSNQIYKLSSYVEHQA